MYTKSHDLQPMFYNNLPYGDTDDFNERVHWDDVWTKNSYRLLTRIFLENNSIMTKAYVLMAIKPEETRGDFEDGEKGSATETSDGKGGERGPGCTVRGAERHIRVRSDVSGQRNDSAHCETIGNRLDTVQSQSGCSGCQCAAQSTNNSGESPVYEAYLFSERVFDFSDDAQYSYDYMENGGIDQSLSDDSALRERSSYAHDD